MSETFTDHSSPAELLRSGAAAGTWELVPEASSAGFAVKHFWGLMTVRGHFERLQGSLDVSGQGQVSGKLTLDADSVQTRNGQRDRHLRSADFFHAGVHPQVEFTSREVSLIGEDRARVRGELTAAGRALPQELDAALRLEDGTSRVALDAAVTVDRTAYGMTWSPMRTAARTALLTVHLVFVKSTT